jgi:hypothetical protein
MHMLHCLLLTAVAHLPPEPVPSRPSPASAPPELAAATESVGCSLPTAAAAAAADPLPSAAAAAEKVEEVGEEGEEGEEGEARCISLSTSASRTRAP